VENAVQANIRALLTENPEAVNQVYNIAVSENFSVNYMFERIIEILGIDAKPQYREARKGDVRNSLADISKAKNLLGYAPQFTFADGLPITVEFFAQ
jgi:UDP-N-acetylglucosamine 4-epimerase